MCIEIISSQSSTVQFIIKIYSVKINGIDWMEWIAVVYFVFILRYQLLCCSGSVLCVEM
jgi:hypothetical protein